GRVARAARPHHGADLTVPDAQFAPAPPHHFRLGPRRVPLAEGMRLDHRGATADHRRPAHRAGRSVPTTTCRPSLTGPDTSVQLPSLAPTRTIAARTLPPSSRYRGARRAPASPARPRSHWTRCASSRV